MPRLPFLALGKISLTQHRKRIFRGTLKFVGHPPKIWRQLAEKEGRASGCARPSPGSPMLRQLAEMKVGPGCARPSPFLPCCASSQKRKVGPGCARPSPFLPCCASSQKRKVGPSCARPSPVLPCCASSQKRKVGPLAAHGPPLVLPCCASSHGSLAKKANFQRFSCNSSCTPPEKSIF